MRDGSRQPRASISFVAVASAYLPTSHRVVMLSVATCVASRCVRGRAAALCRQVTRSSAGAAVACNQAVRPLSILSRYEKAPLDIPGAPANEEEDAREQDVEAVLGEDIELMTRRGTHGGSSKWQAKDRLASAMRGRS